MDHADVAQLVERIARLLPRAEPTMALVTGSVARGLDDGSSDLDVYLYWDHGEAAEQATLADPDRFTPLGASRAFGVPTATGWFTKLRLDGRYVDVEDVDVAVLSRAVAALDGRQAPPGWAVKVAVGIRDAMAVLGGADLVVWQRRLECGDSAATAEVAARLPRLLAPSALYAVTGARGDVLGFTARVSALLLDVVAMLGAVNRRFVPVDDPKWLPWHLAQLTLAPTAFDDRIRAALIDPSPAAMADLDRAVIEALDLIDRHVAGGDTRAARYALSLQPRPGR
jgi:hypothetical protein